MAFSRFAVDQIEGLLKTQGPQNSNTILSYGYPDLNIKGGPAEWLPVHPDTGKPESYAFFERLGYKLVVVDYKELRRESQFGEFHAFDLSSGIFELAESCCMTLDPGTLEHIFLPHNMLQSILRNLALKGIAYHSNPLSAVNHGFFNFSPTYLLDFYMANGFAPRMPHVEPFWPTEETQPRPLPKPHVRFGVTGEWITLIAAERTQLLDQPVWPIQTKYQSMLLGQP